MEWRSLERAWRADPTNTEKFHLFLSSIIRADALQSWANEQPDDLAAYAYAYKKWGPKVDVVTIRPDFSDVIKNIANSSLSDKLSLLYKSGAFDHALMLCKKTVYWNSWLPHLYSVPKDFDLWQLRRQVTETLRDMNWHERSPFYNDKWNELFFGSMRASLGFIPKDFELTSPGWSRAHLLWAMGVKHDADGVPAPKVHGEFVVDGFEFVIYAAKSLRKKAKKQFHHRTYIVCPACDREIPVGRLHQHLTKKDHQID